MGGDRNSASSATRSALADAAAGVAGSLTSMLAFYPVDVYKTNLQAGRERSDYEYNRSDQPNKNTSEIVGRSKNKKNIVSTALYALRIFMASFRGVHYKTAHTVASSFAYFFIYSWITARHRTYVRSSSVGGDGGKDYHPSTSARLVLAALAAMMNTTLTLPLDVVSARKQTASDSDEESSRHADVDDDSIVFEGNNTTEHQAENTHENGEAVPWDKNIRKVMDRAWDEAHIDADMQPDRAELVRIQSDATTGTSGYETANDDCNNGDEEKKGDDESDMKVDTAHETSMPIPLLVNQRQGQRADIKSQSSLWSGLFPSLLLCSNPSIHYTVFDTLKSSVLQRKADRRNRLGTAEGEDRLSMGEAFLIGIMAKFAATIVTYPLIRAKIMLMCNSKKSTGKTKSVPDDEKETPCDSRLTFRRGDTVLNFGGRVCADGASTRGDGNAIRDGESLTLWGVLRTIYRDEGIPGLYRGCNLQLVHTVLKSALLMMVRERIAVTTRRLLLSSK